MWGQLRTALIPSRAMIAVISGVQVEGRDSVCY